MSMIQDGVEFCEAMLKAKHEDKHMRGSLLKDCPFCGSDDVRLQESHRDATIGKPKEKWWLVMCLQCGCQTATFHPDRIHCAVERWNRRPE